MRFAGAVAGVGLCGFAGWEVRPRSWRGARVGVGRGLGGIAGGGLGGLEGGGGYEGTTWGRWVEKLVGD